MTDAIRRRSSLTSGLDILELLDRYSFPLHLSEIADELKMSKANTHQTLKALNERGLVKRTDTLAYHLAPNFQFWGSAAKRREDLKNSQRPA